MNISLTFCWLKTDQSSKDEKKDPPGVDQSCTANAVVLFFTASTSSHNGLKKTHSPVSPGILANQLARNQNGCVKYRQQYGL